MISWPQAKSLNSTPPTKKRKSSTLSGPKSSQRAKSTPVTTPTAGTGILIKLSKNCTCLFASHPSDSPWGEGPVNSQPWLTTQSSIGFSPGPRMLSSMWPPNSWRTMTSETKLFEKLLSHLCPSHSKPSTSYLLSSTSSRKDMCIRLPNLSSSWLNCSRVCWAKKEATSSKTERDTRLVS